LCAAPKKSKGLLELQGYFRSCAMIVKGVKVKKKKRRKSFSLYASNEPDLLIWLAIGGCPMHRTTSFANPAGNTKLTKNFGKARHDPK